MVVAATCLVAGLAVGDPVLDADQASGPQVVSEGVTASRTSAPMGPAPLPWSRGTGELSVSFGGSYTREFGLGEFSVGGGYLLADGLEVGAMASNAALFWHDGRRTVDEAGTRILPNYVLDLTPYARVTILRRRWFSPYVSGGVGPSVYAGSGGARFMGHWMAMPGAWIGLTRRVALELSVRFAGPIPTSQCEDEVGKSEFCTFQWRPRLGVTITF